MPVVLSEPRARVRMIVLLPVIVAASTVWALVELAFDTVLSMVACFVAAIAVEVPTVKVDPVFVVLI